MMRRFTSAPKPASRVARVHLGDVGAVDAQAVAHAVVAGEVRRRLGRRDQVVRREPVRRRRHRHAVDLRARLLERARPRLDRGPHLGLDAVVLGELLDDADAQARRRRASTPASSAARGCAIDVESHGSWPGDRRRAAARRRRPWSRTDRSGRATTRTRPARSATPRRRWASRRRRRTARRAGGSSRRCRSRARAARSPAATAAAEPPLEPPGHARYGRAGCGSGRTPSSRWTSPSRTRRGWSCRRRPRPRRAAARRPSRRTAAASLRGCATSTWSGRRACRGCP